MDFNKLMEEANYNYEAGNKGWFYKWMIKYMSANENTITDETLKTITENIPALETYKNITAEMRVSKEAIEKYVGDLNKVRTQTNARSI